MPSPQTEDSGTPDSIEDTSLPTNHIQASQYSSDLLSSEPQDDPTNAASQCSSERFSCEFPCDDSANISPQCRSQDGASDFPFEETGMEDTKVFVFPITLLPKNVQRFLVVRSYSDHVSVVLKVYLHYSG